jgi:putative FmdB family regulatory protein
MPLYEYACRNCSSQFEALVRSQEPPACPSCHGKDLERRLSVFAAHTGAGASNGFGARDSSAGACGSCGDPRGPGACSMN